MKTLLDIGNNLYVNVFSKAENYPERVAFRTIGKSLTYGQLQERILQAAVAFRENGIDARSCVALDARKSLPSLTATLAFALIGCKWVFASREAIGTIRLCSSPIWCRTGPTISPVNTRQLPWTRPGTRVGA